MSYASFKLHKDVLTKYTSIILYYYKRKLLIQVSNISKKYGDIIYIVPIISFVVGFAYKMY